MNHPDIDFYILQERRKEELAAAAHSRLVKEALRSQSRQSGYYHLISLVVILSRVLAWLGNLLMSWGCSLQSRYSTNPCS